MAQTPGIITHTGFVSDQGGSAIPFGTYPVTFSLYDSENGNNPLWMETVTIVIKNGYFSSNLGDQNEFGAAIKFDQQLWLGIAPANLPELSPRVKLAVVPYSFHSKNADTAGFAWSTSDWKSNPDGIHFDNGNVGIGTAQPEFKLHVNGKSAFVADGNTLAIASDQQAGKSIFEFYQNGLSNDRSGFLGFPSLSSTKFVIQNLDPNGRIELVSKTWIRGDGKTLELYSQKTGGHTFIGYYNNTSSNARSGYVGYPNDGSHAFRIKNEEPNGTIELIADGPTITKWLEITGGCDIKEDLNSLQFLEPGDVVILDQDNPGQIKRAQHAYDRRVAGIISGANEINPGLSLSQTDVMEGEYPLTMVGRVYVKSTGPIEVGDLLTTSNTPGFAMAVSEEGKAFGTVIGKAMSKQEGGDGMVLVLVNLQ